MQCHKLWQSETLTWGKWSHFFFQKLKYVFFLNITKYITTISTVSSIHFSTIFTECYIKMMTHTANMFIGSLKLPNMRFLSFKISRSCEFSNTHWKMGKISALGTSGEINRVYYTYCRKLSGEWWKTMEDAYAVNMYIYYEYFSINIILLFTFQFREIFWLPTPCTYKCIIHSAYCSISDTNYYFYFIHLIILSDSVTS